jgi:DNA replicative helicase MCM subunit Mcm2 (Cdc46/Mcm family)
MVDLFRFLDVDDKFAPDVSTRYNMSGIPQNQIVNSILKQHQRFQILSKRFVPERLRRIARNVRNNNLVKPTIPAEIRNELIDAYKEDIKKLEKLIEKDLSVWMGNRMLENPVKLSSLWLISTQLQDAMELLGLVV